MKRLIIPSAIGNYKPVGNPDNADVIIGHSFGVLTDKNSVNRSLANFILSIADERPIIADRNLVDAFPAGSESSIAHIVEGPVSDTVGNGVGTWGTLVEAKKYMEAHDLELALMVGQAHHIGRIALQAANKSIQLPFVIPENLPGNFERKLTKQWWTYSAVLWFPREVIGSIALERQGKL